MLKEIEYKDANGKSVKAAYADNGSVYRLTGNRERFAQLAAQGRDLIEAYCEAFGVEQRPDTIDAIRDRVRDLRNQTALVLRIADLRKPVLRKLQRKIEYNLQHALAQCEIAWDLAYEQADTKAMLKAVEMQARLSKLLSEEINVNHRHGVLDDTATEILLEMRREIEVRKERAKKLGAGIIVERTVVGPTPIGPLGSHADRVP